MKEQIELLQQLIKVQEEMLIWHKEAFQDMNRELREVKVRLIEMAR